MKYLKKKHSLELQQVLEYMLNVLGTEFPTVRFTSDYFAESLLDSARSNANSIIEHFVMDDNIEELKNYYVDNIKKSMKPIINLIANIDTNVEFDDELSTILKWLTSIFEINSKRQPVFLKEAKFRLEMKFMDLMKPSISKEMIKLACKKRKAV